MNEEEKKKILNCTSETLAAYVVIYKALNIDKERAILCMQELVKRRKDGEDFDYESFIETEKEKLPKMRGINLPELGKKIISGSNFKPFIRKS
jgi:hypothetical protein